MSGKRLPYFLFDGNLNRRHNVSLSNKPTETLADNRETFIKKLKDDRAQREIERQRLESCKRIQAWWRGCRQRTLSIWLCQTILKSGMLSKRVFSEREEKKFLTCCVKYLSHISTSNAALALPLRCIETYFKQEEISISVVSSLIDSGYFGTFKKLIVCKIPPDLSEETVKPPTLFAETVFDALMYPLTLASKCENDFSFKRKIYQKFLSIFFDCELLPAVRFYVLPALCACGKLKLDDFVFAFDDEKFIRQPKYVDLAFSVLYLICHCRYESLEISLKCPLILARILPPVLDVVYKKNKKDSAENEDGEAERMDYTDSNDDYVRQSLNLLNSKTICGLLLTAIEEPRFFTNETSFQSFIYICHTLLVSKEPTGGQEKFLFALSLKQTFLPHLWKTIISCKIPSITGYYPLIGTLQRGVAMNESDRKRFLPLLSVFCALFSNLLLTVNDEELYRDANLRQPNSLMPFSLREMSDVAAVLRDVALGLIELALPDARPNVNETYRQTLIGMGLDLTPQNTMEWNSLFESVVRLVILLHDRDERLQFCPIGHWCVKNRITLQNQKMFRRNRAESRRQLFGIARYLTRRELEDEKDSIMSASEMRTLTILRKIPFVVPFEERVALLYQLTLHDQQENGRSAWTPGIQLHVRRNFIYEDSYDKLAYESASNLKRQLRIMMSNWAGAEEAGVDGGGIFREFLSELLKTGFDPARGLFATTNDQLLYPNPMASKIFPDTYVRHYHFLGRMLGKMIYENQLAEIPFAHFFLSKLLSRHFGDIDIHHLASLDPILHRNLVSLKYMETNVAELYLDFTIMTEQFGEIVKIPLIPDGEKVFVTNENRFKYVQLMADFYLNKQIKEQTEAFREGMSEMIDLDWLQMFDYRELQILISGVDRSFDLQDLRRNTKYQGSIVDSTEEYLSMFWRVVESFSDEQKRKLLKFVTGCSRPPLLGFKDLYPPFTIQLLPPEERRLPTSATCMNLLKLPRFNDENILREKLSYAIEAGAGFELS